MRIKRILRVGGSRTEAVRARRSAAIVRKVYVTEMLEARVLLSDTPAGQIFVTAAAEFSPVDSVGEYTPTGATVNASIVSGFNNPASFALSGSDLFVVNYETATVGEYTTSGATVNASLISGFDSGPGPMDQIALSGSDLYVASDNLGTIGKYTTSGETVNASLLSGLEIFALGASGSDLFVGSFDGIGEYTTSGATVTASLISGLSDPQGIVVSGSDLFVANYNTGTVGEYTTSGATVNASLVSGLTNPSGIAVYGSDIFVTSYDNNGEIGEYTTSGAPVNTSLISNLGIPASLCIEVPQEVDTSQQLVFGQQPSNATAGTGIATSITVDVEDQNGNVVASDNSDVTLSIVGGASGVLGGTTTVAAVNGIATFSNLTFSTAGSYALTASDGRLSPATSTAISVSAVPSPGEIFVARNDTDTIGEYSPSGANVNASLISTLDVFGIAVSGSDVFATLSGGGGGGSIAEYSTSGQTLNDRLVSGLTYPDSVAVSGSDLFVTNDNSSNQAGVGTIGEYTTSGATVNTTLVSGLGYPTGIAVSGSDIFVANEDGTIGEYTTSGATVNASLVSGLGILQGIAVSGSDLFVVNQIGGTIGEYTTSGATVNASLVSGLNNPFGLSLSGSNLFVANYLSGTVGEYTTSGATVNASLISGLGSPDAIFVEPSPVTTAPVITSAKTTTFTTGSLNKFTVTTTGFPIPVFKELGTLPTGVKFVDKGNGNAKIRGTPAAGSAGTYPITIKAKNGKRPNGKQSFTLVVLDPVAANTASPAIRTLDGVAGIRGTFTIASAGLPTASIAEMGTLPGGVSFVDNGNGTATLSGTPSAGTGGAYGLTFSANNGISPVATQGFTLTVDQHPAITSAATTSFSVGTLGKFTVTSTGFPTPVFKESGALPTGVKFVDKGNGKAKIRGTPAAGSAGTYPITIKAKNGKKPNGKQTFTLVVTDPVAVASDITAASRPDTIVSGGPSVDSVLLCSTGSDTVFA